MISLTLKGYCNVLPVIMDNKNPTLLNQIDPDLDGSASKQRHKRYQRLAFLPSFPPFSPSACLFLFSFSAFAPVFACSSSIRSTASASRKILFSPSRTMTAFLLFRGRSDSNKDTSSCGSTFEVSSKNALRTISIYYLHGCRIHLHSPLQHIPHHRAGHIIHLRLRWLPLIARLVPFR